jgi:hypothetical protein
MHLKLVADEPGRHGIDDPIHIDGAVARHLGPTSTLSPFAGSCGLRNALI